jgi:hypothetical protein
MTTPKIYNNINEVLKLYPKIYYENDRSKNKKLEKFSNELYVSPNVFYKNKDGSSFWTQSYKAAKDTLEYLTHLSPFGIKFYVAVFEDGKLKHFVKFIQEPEETVGEYFKYLSNVLDKNVKFTAKDIYNLKNTKYELMNCILKSTILNQESDEKQTYHSLLEDISNGTGIFGLKKHIIPDGMYIYSLRDTLLVRKDGNHPFINFASSIGEKSLNKICKDTKFNSKKFNFTCNVPDKMIPIFNTTGGKDYCDIPIVEYESLNYIKDKFYKYKDKYEFVNKDFSSKIPKAIFRGSATGCGYDDENVRLHLAKVGSKASKNKELSKFLDIGITAGKKKFIYNSKGKIGILDLDAYLKAYDIQRGEFMDKATQSNYKYILVIEGNVAAHRIATDLLLHSVILLVDSIYNVWCSHLMIPYVHYIPIKHDLSDLESQLKYCEANPEKMKTISQEGYRLGKRLLTYKTLEINIIDSLRIV